MDSRTERCKRLNVESVEEKGGMRIDCGRIIVAGDRVTAAVLSSRIGALGSYVPVLEPPRLERLDFTAELQRCINLFRQIRGRTMVQAALPDAVSRELNKHLSPSRVEVVSESEARSYEIAQYANREKLECAPTHILAGLFNALRTERILTIASQAVGFDPDNAFESDHLVVVEDSSYIGSVVAVNYAALVGAHLAVIPAVGKKESDSAFDLLRQFDDAIDPMAKQDLVVELMRQIDRHTVPLGIDQYSNCTFFTMGMPYGLRPSRASIAHVPIYPDCGLTVLKNLVFHQPIRTALIIDPMHLPDTETDSVVEQLKAQSVYVRVLRGKEATVTSVDFHITQLPYDMIFLVSHGGYPTGNRFVVKFLDDSGMGHSLTIRKADSFSGVPGTDKIRVASFNEPEALDGVPWDSPERARVEGLDRVIKDLPACLLSGDAQITSVEENVRMRFCNSIKLHDDLYFMSFDRVGMTDGTVMINNSCCSGHHTASTALYGSVNQYVGTSYSVLSPIARNFAARILEPGDSLCQTVSTFNQSTLSTYGLNCYSYHGLHGRSLAFSCEDNKAYYCSQVADQIRRNQDYKDENPFNTLMERIDWNLAQLHQELKQVSGA